MHKTIYLAAILFFVTITSCKKDDKTNTSPDATQIVTSGTWRITNFTESGENKTSDFTGYSFLFNSSGQLVATLSGTNTTGSWRLDDSSTKFHITIGSSKPLSDLTDDWLIIEKQENLIRLKNDNTSKNEFLDFTKK